MIVERRSAMPVSAKELYRWHTRDGAFERLLPPFDGTRVLSRTGGIENGSRVTLSIPVGPFRCRWIAEHRQVTPGSAFTDAQAQGPFAAFNHVHSMEPDGPEASWLRDRVEFRMPLGPLGRLFERSVAARLEHLFQYRHKLTQDDLAQHRAVKGASPMTVLITGASGLVGSAVQPLLTTGGHKVLAAVRRAAGAGEVRWDPANGAAPDSAALSGVTSIVHLAGENVGQRWTGDTKRAILESRVKGTRQIAEAAARMTVRPTVLVCASAVGYYGGAEAEHVFAEDAPRGDGFLAEVCEAWERAADPARDAGIRVVHLRFGVVLSPKGGALARMLLPFKLGAGGVIGSGKQPFPWIGIEDAAGAAYHALMTPSLSGPVNCVAPEYADNRIFTKTLGRVLSRPTIVPMPAFLARLAFGEMANEMLLAGAHVSAAKLEGSGYRFRHPTLEGALTSVLGR